MAWQLAAPHDETRLGQAGVSSGGTVTVGGTAPPQPYASGRQSGSNLTGTNAVGTGSRSLSGAVRA